MTIIFILYIFISIWLAVFLPRYFVSFYILTTTKFLGFFDVESSFVFGGLALGRPLLHIIIFCVVLFRGEVRKVPRRYRNFSFGIIILLIYGILRPLLSNLESILEAIISSKELWTISFFFYIVKFRQSLSINKLIRNIVYLGIYLSFTYIVYFFIKVSPPYYVNANMFRAYFPTYISLAWFLVHYLKLSANISFFKYFFNSITLLFGLILAGHLSITVTSVFLIGVISIIFKNKISFNFYTTFRLLLFIVVLIFTIKFSKPINSYISNVISGKDVSISSRATYNYFRWEAINDNPIFGYGFIHKNAYINKQYLDISNNRFTERFEVIDSGYVDIIIKFGYLGLVFIVILWGSIIIRVLIEEKYKSPLNMLCVLFLFQYFFINYTWSVFTYTHGLVPAYIAIFIAFLVTKKSELNTLFKN